MITLDRPVIVEGKYDKQKLSSILDATIITTNGFRIFNERGFAQIGLGRSAWRRFSGKQKSA